MAIKRTWGERNTRKLARKRSQALRGSGNSVFRIKTKTRMPDRNPADLNGPVIVKVPGNPDKIQPRDTVVLDRQRYANKELRLHVLARDNFQCRYCGVPVTNGTANIDHIIPWRDGGRTNIDNLVACCTECNRKKGNQQWKPRRLQHHR